MNTKSETEILTLALDCGSRDNLGAAWLIARRSPNLTSAQIARAADTEGMIDVVGRREFLATCKSKQRKDGSSRRTFSFDPTIDDQIERSQPDQTDGRQSLAGRLACELGQLGCELLDCGSVAIAAERCGMSRATAFRRVAECREKFAAEFETISA